LQTKRGIFGSASPIILRAPKIAHPDAFSQTAKKFQDYKLEIRIV
jgi:hypothetical protein